MKVCWNVTSVCNRNCKYCFKFSEKDLPLEENKKILDNLVSLGVEKILWSGGEPFLYDGLIELLELSKKYGLINYINTNDSVLDYEVLKGCLNYIDKINVSLDFVDDKLNSAYGIGENYYNHVKEILKFIREINPIVKIQINTVVFNGNVNCLHDLYDEICKYDIDYWKIIRFFSIRGKALDDEKQLSITEEDFKKICLWLSEKNPNFEIRIHGLKEMQERHLIVLSSGELVCSENFKDIVVDEQAFFTKKAFNNINNKLKSKVKIKKI